MRRHEKERRSFSELSAKPFAGLLSPRPRFLSCRKERNQRFAKEEVSSLETPLRGFSPRELRKAKFSPPVCSASKQMSGFAPATSGSKRLRRCSFYPRSGVSKFKRGLPLSLEVKEPGGSLCALCETFFTQESFRGRGLRKPAIDFAEGFRTTKK